MPTQDALIAIFVLPPIMVVTIGQISLDRIARRIPILGDGEGGGFASWRVSSLAQPYSALAFAELRTMILWVDQRRHHWFGVRLDVTGALTVTGGERHSRERFGNDNYVPKTQ